MDSKPGFLYRKTMKESRKMFRKMGVPLIIFLILYDLAMSYVFVPILGKIWGLALKTTPDGFISLSNAVNTLLKSPWILLVGAILIIAYAILVMWQVVAILVGIGYMHKGQKIRLRDLVRISLVQLGKRLRARNWMVMVYAIIVMPFANLYQTNDLVTTLTIPEYIQDFINSKMILLVLFIILALFILYIALRWFFLLPSFVLKGKDFRAAKEESKQLTSKRWIRNGFSIGLYNFFEYIRLGIIPVILIMLPVFICYLKTSNLEFSANLYSNIGISWGFEFVKAVTCTLVQVSTLCFLVNLYFVKQKECGVDDTILLPELNRVHTGKVSCNVLMISASVIFSALILLAYFSTVKLVQADNGVILELFGRTDVIAHKGYSSIAPENTMPAFERADKANSVTLIELDVRTTKDGIPVVIHNATITDATGINKEVYECTYEELQQLPAPYNMSPKEFPDARIPSLEDVIKKYAGSTPLLIEIKGYDRDPQLPEKIVSLMKKYQCDRTCSIQSGDYDALKAVKNIDPEIRCGLIITMVTGAYYDLPYADFFSIEHTFVTHNTVSQLHRRDKGIYAWTVNYSDSADNLRFLGVDGIITDVPDTVNQYFNDSNEMVDTVHNSILDNIKDYLSTEDVEKALENYDSGNY